MATGTLQPGSQPPMPPSQGAKGDAYDAPTFDGPHSSFVVDELNRTRSSVKLVDLGSSIILLLTGVLAFVLAMSFVDHWLFNLGTAGRWLACLALVGGLGWFLAQRVIPAIVRGINPIYAAHTIEKNQPWLKNSLVNFLLLRRDRGQVREVVYEAVEQQAAANMHRVEADNTVDTSPLIRLGYVLAGLVVIGGLYKIVSPKDPFQTFARILAPWADISRPTRVTIPEVTPGDTEVLYSQSLKVTAKIKGLRGEETPRIIYSTVDGKVVDRAIDMTALEDRDIYQAELPDNNSGSGSAGVQSDLTYRIEAGDAQTRDYRVQVQAAPSIVVRQIQIDHPPYANLPQKIVAQNGNIEALAGSLVTITAEANWEIEGAYLEFDPDKAAVSSKPSSWRRAMKVTGKQATVTFELGLVADEKDKNKFNPEHSSYQLRFWIPQRDPNGEKILNAQPSRYSILVTPDVAPIVEILKPEQEDIDLPLDGKAMIEVRSYDPDFALSKVKIRGEFAGEKKLDRVVYSEKQKREKPIDSFELVPKDLKLKVGDTLLVWAEAEDNRQTFAKAPLPNLSRTRTYKFHITDAQSQQNSSSQQSSSQQSSNPQSSDSQQNSPTQQQNNPQQGNSQQGNSPQNQPQQGQPPQQNGSQQQNPSKGNSGEKPQQPAGEGSDKDPSQSPQAGPKGSQPQETQPKDQQPKDPAGKPNQQQPAQQNQNPSQNPDQKSGDAQSQNSQAPNAQPQKSQPNESPAKSADGSKDPMQQNSSNDTQKQPGEIQPGEDKQPPPSGEKQPSGEKPQGTEKQPGSSSQEGNSPQQSGANQQGSSQQSGEKKPGGESGNSQPSSQPNGNQQGSQKPEDNKPLPATGEKDGDAIQRIADYVKEQQKKQGNSPEKSQDNQQANADKQPAGDKQPGDKNPTAGSEGKSGEKPANNQPNEKPGENSSSQPGGAKSQEDKKPGPSDKPDDQQSSKLDKGNSPGGDKQNSTTQQPAGPDSKEEGQGTGSGNPMPSDKSAGGNQSTDMKQGQSGEQGSKDQGNKTPGDKTPGDKTNEKPGEKSGNQSGKPSELPKGTPQGEQKPADGQTPTHENDSKPPQGVNGQPTTEKPTGDKKQPDPAQKGSPMTGNGQNQKGNPQKPDGKTPGTDGQGQQGKPGDGQDKSNPTKGTPQAQGDNVSKDPTKQNDSKTQQPNEKKPGEEGNSPSISPKQSDTKGSSEGDRSGDGSKGGGQPAKQPGQSQPGTESAAEQGNGQAKEPGQGDASNKPGSDKPSPNKTGKSGDERGAGSNTRASDQGDKPQPGDQNQASQKNPMQGDSKQSDPKQGKPSPDQAAKSDGKTGDGKSNDGKPGDGKSSDGKTGESKATDTKPGDQKSQPTAAGGGNSPRAVQDDKNSQTNKNQQTVGAGQAGAEPSTSRQPPPAVAGSEDAANLDHARKTTDMVLDYLKHNKGKADPKLLDKLGWTQQEADAFAERWSKLKSSADKNPKAKQNLEDRLRGLGLGQTQTGVKAGITKKDSIGTSDAGSGGNAPSKYKDKYNAYLKGTSQGTP